MAEERFGPLYLMVNNAGIMGAMGYMDEMGVPEFEATLAVNLTSVFMGSKHAIRSVRSLCPASSCSPSHLVILRVV